MIQRRAVRWLSPWTLLRLLHARLLRWRSGWAVGDGESSTPGGEMARARSFDFVADTGDGFDATATIAWLMAQDELSVGEGLTRADGIVHGGDMVYPAGVERVYEDRYLSIMRAVSGRPKRAPWLLAIPGNHDRYDGLHAWRDVVTSRRSIGMWQTIQTEPWFARRLSSRWWVIGIAPEGKALSDAQWKALSDVAAQLDEQSALVLVVSKPVWSQPGPNPLEVIYSRVVTMLEESGATVRVWLTGDEHNYHRYVDEMEVHYVTAGGGGAFLSTTHRLPDQPEWRGNTLRLQPSVYPLQEVASALRWKAPRLIFRNGSLPLLIGGLYALVGLFYRWLEQPAGYVLATAIALPAAIAFTRSASRLGMAVGLIHALMHSVVFAALAPLSLELWPLVGSFAVAGATVGTLLVSVGLIIGSMLGINDNELFSALRIDDYRCFVRCVLADNETLTLHAIGVDHAVRDWDTSGQLAPAVEPAPRRIEPPVVVSPTS